MIYTASAIANFAYEEEDSDKALDQAEQLLYGIREEEGYGMDAGPVKAWAVKYMDRVEELSQLDGALAGLPTLAQYPCYYACSKYLVVCRTFCRCNTFISKVHGIDCRSGSGSTALGY